jgi:hypothetical protein
MDIGSHRPSLAHRTSSDEKLSLAASSTVYTYHCLCTHLLLATTTPLPALPTRQHCIDKAHIMPLPPPPNTPTNNNRRSQPNTNTHDHYGLMLSTITDRQPEIIQSDDGFEKRYLQRCGRCSLVVGYQLDWQQFAASEHEPNRSGRRDDVVFLLPGGFVTTAEMIMGKTPGAGAIGIVSIKELKA